MANSCSMANISSILLFASVLALCTSSGCNMLKGDDTGKSSHLCAQVNGKRIYVKDFENEFRRITLDIEEEQIEYEEQMKLLKKELLLIMIDKELLIQEAKSKGIKAGDDDLEIYLNDLARGYPPEKFPMESYLKDPAYKGQRSLILEGILIKKLIQKLIEPVIHVSEKEIREFFLAHKNEFDRNKMFRARQIVVESEVEARQILGLLKSGHDFTELAKKWSLSPDKDTGGDLGFFELGQMPPEFDEVVLNLKKGEISDVVQSDYGYHIFQLIDVLEPQKATWEDAKPRIEQILMAQKRDDAFQNLLAELRDHAKIKIYPKAIF